MVLKAKQRDMVINYSSIFALQCNMNVDRAAGYGTRTILCVHVCVCTVYILAYKKYTQMPSFFARIKRHSVYMPSQNIAQLCIFYYYTNVGIDPLISHIQYIKCLVLLHGFVGERLIQFASENLVTEILIHPQYNTLIQCMRNLLSSFTRHRHIIHSGYTFSGNGSWILQVCIHNFEPFFRHSPKTK